METKIFDVRDITENKVALSERLKDAAALLSQGKTVAFPTETVYGLGANALDEAAVKKIYEAKGRPSDNPLIVHIAELSQLNDIVEFVPYKAELIMKHFWPGPISIIMNKKNCIPDCVSAGLKTIAVRMPENPEAFVLLKLAGCPVAAPSANLSGKPSPTKPEHVIHDLRDRVDGIVAGRVCDVGIESTVIDTTCEPPVILRPGIVTKEDLEKVIGTVLVAPRKTAVKASSAEIPKAPGMKYTHYAPDAPMILFEGVADKVFAEIAMRADSELKKGKTVGLIVTDETADRYHSRFNENERCIILSVGSMAHLESVAHNVFDILRKFDELKADIILSEAFEDSGIGFSVMNRMDKAATEIRQT